MKPTPFLVVLATLLIVPLASAGGLTTDATSLDMQTGDTIVIHSTLTNSETTTSPPTLVYLSLLDKKQGAPVDLEDWTANRSTNVPPLAPGESATQTWSLRALVSGEYDVYVISVPNATSTQTPRMSLPVAIHVTQRTNLNPGGVLPVAIGLPLVIGVGMIAIRHARSRSASTPPTRKENTP